MANLRFSGLRFLVPLLLALTGCAHVISSEVRESARKDLAFPVVLQDPDAYRGETVIWGGLIIETLNLQEGTTITVLETPLDSQGMPANEETSRGRFKAVAASYLDNEVYQKGRRVTLAGEVLGKEVQPLGQTQYSYPLLSVRELHLWSQEYRPYGYFYGPYSWGPHWWYWDWWWPYRRYRHW